MITVRLFLKLLVDLKAIGAFSGSLPWLDPSLVSIPRELISEAQTGGWVSQKMGGADP